MIDGSQPVWCIVRVLDQSGKLSGIYNYFLLLQCELGDVGGRILIKLTSWCVSDMCVAGGVLLISKSWITASHGFIQGLWVVVNVLSWSAYENI